MRENERGAGLNDAFRAREAGERSLRTVQALALLAVLLCVALPMLAALTGDIQGTVLDPTGLVVADAKVSIRKLDTGLTRVLTTDSAGEFAALQLEIGEYQVRVEKHGFRTYTMDAVVRSGETTRLNIKLELGQAAQMVRVQAVAGPALDVASAQLSTSVDADTVKNLPLVTRDPLTLSSLAPGVVPVTPNNPFLGSGSFNSNGQRGRANNITIDNITSTDISTTGGAGLGTLSLDQIQEFKLITNNFSAEFGRNAGAQLQIITKGGTNQYHGTAYWFHNDAALNARDFFDRTGHATPFIRNQWGFTAGGPAIRNHTFLFGHYEGLKIRGSGDTRNATVLTPTQVAGITDPTSRAVFAALGAPQSAAGRLTNSAPNVQDAFSWSVRVDQQWNGGRDVLTGRFAYQTSSAASPGLTFIETNLPNYGATSVTGPRNFSLGYTRSFTSAVVNQFRVAYGRSSPQFAPNTTLSKPFAPEVRIATFANMGVSRLLPQGRIQNIFQYSDVLSWAKDRHSWKFGLDVFRYQANSVFDANFRGIASFASVADYQVGRLQRWVQNIGNSGRGNRASDVFAYIQDDFRLTSTLTLNLGARMESSGGVEEVHSTLSNLDLQKPGPIGGAGPGRLGSFDLGGEAFHRNWNVAPRLGFAWNPHSSNLVLRGGYGWAYDYLYLNPITNLRFVAPFIIGIGTNGPFTGNNTWANLVAGNSSFQQQAQATVGRFNPAFRNFGTISPVDQRLKNPRATQWNLGAEYQLLREFVLKATYSGTKGDFLQVSREINILPPGVIPRPATSATDEFNRRSTFFRTFVAESGPANGSSNRLDPRLNTVTLLESSGSSIYHSLQIDVQKRMSHGYGFGVAYTWGHSIDDVSDALGVLVNDSPTIQDPRNLRDNRGDSQFDVRHRLVINHTFEPTWANHLTGVAGKVLDGWAFTGIFQIQSGFPATIFAGTRRSITDALFTGTSNVRADFNGGSFTPVPQGSPAAALISGLCARGVVTSLDDPACTNTSNFPFTQPLLGNPGHMGRNTLRLNKFQQVDWAIIKNTKIAESQTFEFRFEMYNVFNTPTFARFVNTLSSPNFGLYQGTDTNSRRLQFGLKYIF